MSKHNKITRRCSMNGFQVGALHCGWRVSFMPSYRKMFRTFVFVVAMGAMTAYLASMNGDWKLLVPFLAAILLVFGIDGFEVQIGSFYLHVPGDDDAEFSQRDKDDDS